MILIRFWSPPASREKRGYSLIQFIFRSRNPLFFPFFTVFVKLHHTRVPTHLGLPSPPLSLFTHQKGIAPCTDKYTCLPRKHAPCGSFLINTYSHKNNHTLGVAHHDEKHRFKGSWRVGTLNFKYN